ncbi:uncharacterized protein [Argopecten irradians]|uniref:uncharacterized protein n=1 Tax=Argopecten irradians TaxID=31199 RepID=UPI00372059A1
MDSDHDDSLSISDNNIHVLDEDISPQSSAGAHVFANVNVVDDTEPPAQNTRNKTAGSKTQKWKGSTGRLSSVYKIPKLAERKTGSKKAENVENSDMSAVLTAINSLTAAIGQRDFAQAQSSGNACNATSAFVLESDNSEHEIDAPARQNVRSANFSFFDSECGSVAEAADCPEENFTFQLADIFDKKKLGPAVCQSKPKIAEDITTAVRTNADVSELKQLYKIPKNLECLLPPRTNSEVWGMVSPQFHGRDRLMQDLQELLAHSLTPIMFMIEKLRLKDLDMKEIQVLLNNAVSLLCNLHYEMSVKRRFMLRSGIKHSHLQSLCNSETPIGAELFGDNVAKRIKDLDEVHKATYRRNSASKNGQWSGRGQQWSGRGYYNRRGQRGRYRRGRRQSFPNQSQDKAKASTQ